MPPRWIHTLVDLIAFGLEPSWIHKSKDCHWRKLGSKHRKYKHPFYVELEKKLRKGISFIEIFDNAIPVITDEAKKFESLIQKRYNISIKKPHCVLTTMLATASMIWLIYYGTIFPMRSERYMKQEYGRFG